MPKLAGALTLYLVFTPSIFASGIMGLVETASLKAAKGPRVARGGPGDSVVTEKGVTEITERPECLEALVTTKEFGNG